MPDSFKTYTRRIVQNARTLIVHHTIDAHINAPFHSIPSLRGTLSEWAAESLLPLCLSQAPAAPDTHTPRQHTSHLHFHNPPLRPLQPIPNLNRFCAAKTTIVDVFVRRKVWRNCEFMVYTNRVCLSLAWWQVEL